MTLSETSVDLETTRGPMRVHVFAPAGGGCHPGVIFYSEIYQATGPIRRTAAALAGEGYVVAVPEVYHEFEPAGSVLAYDAEGTNRGNALKLEKEIGAMDEDTCVVVDFLNNHEACTGKLATFGVCLGGHLAIRAGFHSGVSAVGAFYPTDLHTGKLGRGQCADTLTRLPEMKASLLLVFGRQDPHVPVDARRLIRQTLEDSSVEFEWHEFNAAHAFLRDEGPRYNPPLARVAMSLLLRFLAEKLS